MMYNKFLHTLILLIFLIGCSAPQPSSPSHTFRMNIGREPTTLDPRKGSDLVSASLHYLLYEGLFRLNATGDIVPAQAISVEISEDRRVYTFHLRESRWSDGSLVTAQDFESSWKKMVDPSFSATTSPLFYCIKNGEKAKKGEVSVSCVGIHAADVKTLIVELERPTPYFLQLTSTPPFFPVHPNYLVNGPFFLKSWKHHFEIALEKNKTYWDHLSIDLHQIVMMMVGNQETALHLYEKGELDILGTALSPISTEALLHYQKQKKLHSMPVFGTTVLFFNTEHPLFKNQNIRKALSYSIRRLQLVEKITCLGEEAAITVVPPQLYAYRTPMQSAESPRQYLERGLAELGLSLNKFPKLKLAYSFPEVHHKVAQVLQQWWQEELGLSIELYRSEHKTLLHHLGNRSYELALSFWMAQYPDPMSILDRFRCKENPKNYSSWENVEFRQLLEQSDENLSSEKRTETLLKAEALLLDEMPIAPLYHWTASFLLNDRFDYPPLSANGFFDYARIYVKKDSL